MTDETREAVPDEQLETPLVDEAADVPQAEAGAPEPQGLDEGVRQAIRDEFDEVVPYLVTALKRNEAFDQLVTRLDRAEKKLAERERRPLVAGLVRVLHRLRRTEFDAEVKESLLHELEALLVGAGYEEFGEVGEPFDAARHEAVEGSVDGGPAVVKEIYEQGLETLGEVVVPARVRVGSDTRETESEQ